MPRNDGADLPDLIRLRLATGALHVDQLLDPRSYEDVMAASHPFLESEMQEQSPQVVEADVRVAPASEDLEQSLLMLGHSAKLPHRGVPGQVPVTTTLPPQNVYWTDLHNHPERGVVVCILRRAPGRPNDATCRQPGRWYVLRAGRSSALDGSAQEPARVALG